ncbi:hypothetical protein [Rosenbergiella epipactidis]|nr:hypothetical protein [Rosenbergiella epipactidis]
MSAIVIMQLAASAVKGQRVTLPALNGAEFRLFLDALRVMQEVRA